MQSIKRSITAALQSHTTKEEQSRLGNYSNQQQSTSNFSYIIFCYTDTPTMISILCVNLGKPWYSNNELKANDYKRKKQINKLTGSNNGISVFAFFVGQVFPFHSKFLQFSNLVI